MAAAETVAFFRAAASYLARAELRCPTHQVAHTGKLARGVVLDLALCDATGDARHWERAVARAQWVAGRLAPDPEHGALIYLPGRLDPRNCSNSVIDSGECTDALARLLRHERAHTLPPEAVATLRHAVERNAETYLLAAVVEKEITNQRLWGAMGLASAHALLPNRAWCEALRESLARSVAEQHADGSWPYQPDALREGAHPGATDVSVYYHSRCLAFLLHVTAVVPELESEAVRDAVRRGFDFLALVLTPDGLKPLNLEGKRWFWDGSYEAGSTAFDVFALHAGAGRLGRPELRELAVPVWRQLRRHQLADGSISSCLERSAADFVCPDFHTADLAWSAQVLANLDDASVPRGALVTAVAGVREAPNAGVLRLESSERVVLIRTDKRSANTQFGGAVGGGSLASVVDRGGRSRLEPGAAQWTVVPPFGVASSARVRAFLRENPPRREGRQWLFVARLLLRAGQPAAALRRLWHGVGRDALWALRGVVSSAWALSAERHEGEALAFESSVAERSGKTPRWAASLRVVRRYATGPAGLMVRETLRGTPPRRALIRYAFPAAAANVQVDGEGVVLARRGSGLHAFASGAPIRVDVTYAL